MSTEITSDQVDYVDGGVTYEQGVPVDREPGLLHSIHRAALQASRWAETQVYSRDGLASAAVITRLIGGALVANAKYVSERVADGVGDAVKRLAGKD